jgi:lipocalin-like protein
MKKLIYVMAIAGCCALSSCNNDDDNNNANADYAGTYNMTAWNAPVAMDFDGNGTTSANFMTESNCYNNSRMTLNSNGTYNMTYNSMGITGTTTNCAATQTTTGTWTRSGNSIMTTATGSASADTYSFANGSGSNGATLSRSMTNVQYPTLSGSTASWANGNVNMMFTRESAN